MEKTNITQILVMNPGGTKSSRSYEHSVGEPQHSVSEFLEKYPRLEREKRIDQGWEGRKECGTSIGGRRNSMGEYLKQEGEGSLVETEGTDRI